MWITNSNKEKRLEVEKKQIKGAEEEMKKGLKKKERITKRVFDGVLLIIFGSFFLIGKGAKGVFGFLEKWSGGKK